MKIIFLFLLQVYSASISVISPGNRRLSRFNPYKNVKSQVSFWRKKKLLLSAVGNGNYSQVKNLLEEIGTINLKDAARICRNSQILGLLVQKDAKIIEEISRWWGKRKSVQVLKELPSLQVAFKDEGDSLISQIIQLLGDEREFELLRQMGKIDPVQSLQQIIKKSRDNIKEIKLFLEENTSHFDKNHKKKVLDILQKTYLLESVGGYFPYLVLNLKEGLDEEDLLELKKSESYYQDLQCQICMERAIECYFSCYNSRRFRHGACHECFFQVARQENAKCPWCRTRLY